MKRISEWITVLRAEKKKPDIWMLRFLFTPWHWRSRRNTLLLLSQCFRCPIYNRSLHMCRPWLDAPYGCGCHMPTKARFGGGCWAQETGETEIGWREQ